MCVAAEPDVILVFSMFQIVHRISDPRCHMLIKSIAQVHGFDSDVFPFVIVKSATHYSLVNVKKGISDTLITDPSLGSSGSAQVFFIGEDSGFTVHFCSHELLANGERKEKWIRLHLDQDFSAILEKYGRLPTSSNID